MDRAQVVASEYGMGGALVAACVGNEELFGCHATVINLMLTARHFGAARVNRAPRAPNLDTPCQRRSARGQLRGFQWLGIARVISLLVKL